jgi:hypothetical protein
MELKNNKTLFIFVVTILFSATIEQGIKIIIPRPEHTKGKLHENEHMTILFKQQNSYVRAGLGVATTAAAAAVQHAVLRPALLITAGISMLRALTEYPVESDNGSWSFAALLIALILSVVLVVYRGPEKEKTFWERWFGE